MDFVDRQQRNKDLIEGNDINQEEASESLSDILQKMQFENVDEVSKFLKEKFGVEENLKLGPEMTQEETLTHLKDQMVGKKDDHDEVIEKVLKPRKGTEQSEKD